ncbi:hypothetical protein GS506_20555 [Rhodococcus hoagii]|nr:hypothetical protein [Prescottella equi]
MEVGAGDAVDGVALAQRRVQRVGVVEVCGGRRRRARPYVSWSRMISRQAVGTWCGDATVQPAATRCQGVPGN